MRTWSEEKSQEYVERFRGYRGDTKYRKCGWFGHMAHHCRRMEIEAEREQRGGLFENRWKPLEYRVIACDEECGEPTPEPELSQLLFYQHEQRELIRVSISLVCLLIHISNDLYTYYPMLPTK